MRGHGHQRPRAQETAGTVQEQGRRHHEQPNKHNGFRAAKISENSDQPADRKDETKKCVYSPPMTTADL